MNNYIWQMTLNTALRLTRVHKRIFAVPSFVEASGSQSGFFAEFYFEKSWNKRKQAFGPQGAMMEKSAHQISVQRICTKSLCMNQRTNISARIVQEPA